MINQDAKCTCTCFYKLLILFINGFVGYAPQQEHHKGKGILGGLGNLLGGKGGGGGGGGILSSKGGKAAAGLIL